MYRTDWTTDGRKHGILVAWNNLETLYTFVSNLLDVEMSHFTYLEVFNLKEPYFLCVSMLVEDVYFTLSFYCNEGIISCFT